jgi:hypothetical protein
MRIRSILTSTVLVALSWAAPFACSPSEGGGDDGGDSDAGRDSATDGSTDGGADSGDDTGADAPLDTGEDARDAGEDAIADAGEDAPADAGEDADAETDAGDAGTCASLYCGPANDFAVDATNLYVMVPVPGTTDIVKCPLSGCGPTGPTAVLLNSHASQIEAADGVVYFGFVGFGPLAAHIKSIPETGGAPTELWTYSGPPNISFLALRYNDRVLYGSVKGQGMGTPAFYIRARVLLPGAGAYWNELSGAPVFDVRGDFAIMYDDDPSGPPGNPGVFKSERISTGVETPYTVPTPRPARVTINPALVAWRAADGSTYFCERATPCAAPVLVAGVSSADVALDADYMYMATPTGVMRCATSEMTGAGTCTATSFLPTAAAALQVVLTPTAVYARTAEPSIVAAAIP